MKKLILSIALFSCIFSKAQEIQWASKAIKFSSDLGGKQNGIKRILGRPDAFPQAGFSSNAWMPKNALDGREIVEVGFEKPQTVKQIAVFENLNSGCVIRVWVDNGSGNYQSVWTRKQNWKTPTYHSTLGSDRAYYFKRKRRKVYQAPDVFNPGIETIILDNAMANIVAVKVEFNFALVPGQKQIDAIGISDAAIPLDAKINTNQDFENLQNANSIAIGNLMPSCPMVSYDGQKLYFTEGTNEKELIYYCSKSSDGKWINPVPEENNYANKNENFNYLFAHQPEFILRGGMKYDRGTGETGYEFLDADFMPIKPLKIAAFNNYGEASSATISNDAKTIIMGIESDMTQGSMDLYFSAKKEDGTYGLLQNLGKTINSAADEETPDLLSDQKTMIFSSNGFSGFGDYDLYITHRLDETWKKWSEPINLGSKINSQGYEGSPYYDEKTETLYFIKSVDGKSTLQEVKISKSTLIKPL